LEFYPFFDIVTANFLEYFYIIEKFNKEYIRWNILIKNPLLLPIK
jgi:hypothetical protein